MRNYRFVYAAVLLLAIAAVAAAAQPNFTGTWKMNASKSEFGEMPAPNSLIQTITHNEPNLTVSTKQSSDMGDFEFEAKYTTDGKECVNMRRDNPATSVLKWEGSTLVITTKSKFGDTDFTTTERWDLSADGKELTINRQFSSSFGEGSQKTVLEKQ